MKNNERLQALRVINKLLQDKTPLSHLIAANPDLSSLSKDLCFGVSRYYFRLQAIAEHLIDKKPKSLAVWVSVLMGLYQLHYQRTPDYAVVKETVALMDKLKMPWAKGLVNAALRRFCREKTALIEQLEQDKVYQCNHPEWLTQKIQTDWPQDWKPILLANDQHPPMSLRVNTRKTSIKAYLERLENAGIEAMPLQHSMHGIVLKHPCDVHTLPGFAQGDVSVQDEAAQLAAGLLDLQPKQRVLDACCAPGGKTAHILETEPELATLVALDVDKTRLARVKENMNRLQLSPKLIQGDAVKPQTWWDGKPFDRILLDAPCSATGVIRRHPDIKILRHEKDIDAVVQLQSELLRALWPLLSKEGLLVYATCSIMPEENTQLIAQFTKEQADCQQIISDVPWGRMTDHGWQILPGDHNMDGFFYSVLKKVE